MSAGKILNCSPEYIITCHSCLTQDQITRDNLKQVERDYRSWGWSKTVKYGWVCHDCKRSKYG